MRAMRRLWPAALLVLVVAGALDAVSGESARAQSLVSSGESFVDVRLLAGRAQADGSRLAALVVEVAPEWKTYWRSPGAAGVPPSFDWSKSGNLASAEVLWPRPHAFQSFGLETLGYAGQVVFPLRLRPHDADKALDLHLTMAMGVCRDICVLEETSVERRIGPAAPPEGADLLAGAEAEVPRPGAEVGLRAATCRISGAGPERRFDAVLDFDRPLSQPMVILEGPEMAWFTGIEAGTDPATGKLSVSADLSLLDPAAWINRSDIRMTVLDGDFAADIRGCTAPER